MSGPVRYRAPTVSRLCVFLAAGIVLGGMLVAFGVPAAQAQSTVNVTIQGFSFNPGTVTVVVGVNNTVSWTNMDSVTHTVTSDTGAFGGTVPPGRTFTFTFTVAGTYGYHCSIHNYMKGTVVVISSGATSTGSSTTATSSSSSTTTAPSTSSTTTSTATATTSTVSTTSITSQLPTTTASSTTQTASSATSTTVRTTSAESSPTATTTSTGSGGIPEFPLQGTLVAVVTLALVASYFVIRRSGRGPHPLGTSPP